MEWPGLPPSRRSVPEVVVEQRATNAPQQRGRAARRLVTLPLGLVAGCIVGTLAFSRWGAPPLLTLVYGVVTALLVARGREQIGERVAVLAEARPESVVVALLPVVLDMLIGAAIGLAAAPLLDASTASAMGTGGALAGVWSFTVGRLLFGDSVDRAVDFMLAGSQGADFSREPILAEGEALERAGRIEAAIARYREVAERRPLEPEAYLRAARLLRQEGRALEAAQTLHLARQRAHLTSGHELLIGQTLAELAAGPLGDPVTAAEELALLVARFAGAPQAEAARRRLAELQAPPPAQGGPGRPVAPGAAGGGSKVS